MCSTGTTAGFEIERFWDALVLKLIERSAERTLEEIWMALLREVVPGTYLVGRAGRRFLERRPRFRTHHLLLGSAAYFHPGF